MIPKDKEAIESMIEALTHYTKAVGRLSDAGWKDLRECKFTMPLYSSIVGWKESLKDYIEERA